MQTQQHVRVRPCTYTDDEYAAIAALNNVNFPEFPTSIEELRHDDEHRPEHCQEQRFVAECDGRVVGHAEYFQHPGTYDPHKFELDFTLAPEYLGRGIGKQLFDTLMDALRPFEPTRVAAYAREDMPRRVRFLEDRGFTSGYGFFSSEVDLTSFDPTRFGGAIEHVQAEGIVLRTMRELRADDPDFERKLYDLWLEIEEDIPMAPGDVRQHRPFEVWLERNMGHPALLEEHYHVAVDV
jgi:GNAT superfamily N-acetyltransferase